VSTDGSDVPTTAGDDLRADAGSAGPATDRLTSPATLRIINGNPTPEELAAVTVVLTALSGGGDAGPTPVIAGGWADPALRLRRPIPPGPGAWRASVWY
jgi:hypothetical protein